MDEPAAKVESTEGQGSSSMQAPSRSDTRVGVLITGRYQLMERLGKGGMAAVYRAVDLETGKDYAVKFLDRRFMSDPDMARRCQREARTMAEIESRHVPRAFVVGTTPDNEIYFVMEFLRGRDLDQVLTKEGPLPWRRAASIGLQLCEALAAAHSRNIIHRDVKPSNCFLVEGGDADEDFVKLIDFGIAKDLDASGEQTSLGLVLGTPGYVAPELLAGEARASPATDVYGLGVTLYKLMSGRLPWTPSSTGDTTYAQMFEPPRPLREFVRGPLPPTVEAAVMQAFERDPAKRFRSVEEFMAALRLALEEPRAVPPSGSVLRELPATAPLPNSGGWGREAALVAAAAALLFGGAWSLAPAEKPGRGGSGRVPVSAVRPMLSYESSREPVARKRAAIAELPAQAESVEARAVPEPPAAAEAAAIAPSAPAAPARPFSASKVEAQLDRRVSDMRVCAKPGADRLRFTLVVNADGSVAEVQATPAAFRQCIADQLDGVKFPASDAGGSVNYTFRAADAAKAEKPEKAAKPATTKSKKPAKHDPLDDLLPVGGK